jgi:hypothetical protein
VFRALRAEAVVGLNVLKQVRRNSFEENLELFTRQGLLGAVILTVCLVSLFERLWQITLALVHAAFPLPLPQEDQIEGILYHDHLTLSFVKLAVVAPYLETAIFHFAPLMLVTFLTATMPMRKKYLIDGLAVGFTIGVFAMVHGFNSEEYSVIGGLLRVPAGVGLSFITYAFLVYGRGGVRTRMAHGFIAPFLVHAIANACTLLYIRILT